MPSTPSDADILYFCDESSQVDDEFMAVAGLAVSRRMVPTIARDLVSLNRENGVTSEVKWTTAKSRRVSIHKLYANYIFNLIESNSAHFHIRFAPFSQYDHSRSGDRNRIDTVSKMYYQLLLHRAVEFYGPKRSIYVFPDNGDCTSYLPNMRNQLCADGYRNKGCLPNCIRAIEPRDSKREPLLQLLDVLLGALAAAKNGRILGKAKTELADHIISYPGVPSLADGTPWEARRLNIWNVTPKWN